VENPTPKDLTTWMLAQYQSPIIKWQHLPELNLQAYVDYFKSEAWLGLRETDMDPVQLWCEEHDCGKRMSFDTFCFRSKKEMTMFLLRWG
jgi:hypothetical protein